jgi:hypothetical protein
MWTKMEPEGIRLTKLDFLNCFLLKLEKEINFKKKNHQTSTPFVQEGRPKRKIKFDSVFFLFVF